MFTAISSLFFHSIEIIALAEGLGKQNRPERYRRQSAKGNSRPGSPEIASWNPLDNSHDSPERGSRSGAKPTRTTKDETHEEQCRIEERSGPQDLEG
jgi:hypothetical protein